MKKTKILVSAYACNPESSLQRHPGEDIAGWELMLQLSRFNELWVITHSYNEKGIKRIIKQNPIPEVHFSYLNLPYWLSWFYKIEFGQRIYYYFWQILAWKTARSLHRKVHFNVAHHLTFGNDWMPSFIGAFLNIPFIWGPLGGGQRTPKSLMKEYSLYGRFAEKVRNLSQWIGRNHYFRRKCLKRAKAVLVCNQETKTKVPKKYHRKTYFFPVNGISTDDIFFETSNENQQGTFRVLTAGRFQRLKGFALAIKAYGIFSERHSKTEFIIVGKGPEQNHLERLIQILGLKTKVKIHNWIPRKELFQMMNSADVFFFPSFRDGGGAVVVEAMASGKPVVCLDVGGPGFHIKKEWGIKITPESPDIVISEMASALEKLYLNRDLMKKMGEAARKQAEQFYLWDHLGEQLKQIYLQVFRT